MTTTQQSTLKTHIALQCSATRQQKHNGFIYNYVPVPLLSKV